MNNNLYYFKLAGLALFILCSTSCGHYRITYVNLDQTYSSRVYREHDIFHKRNRPGFKYFLHSGTEVIELYNVDMEKKTYYPPEVPVRSDSVVMTGKVIETTEREKWIRTYDDMNEDPLQKRRLESKDDKKYIVQAHVFCDSVMPSPDGVYTIRQDEMKDYVIYYKDKRGLRFLIISLTVFVLWIGLLILLLVDWSQNMF